MSELQSILESHTKSIISAVLASLKNMSIEEIYKLANGNGSSGGGAAPTTRRGPGRPKKAAASAAPRAAKPAKATGRQRRSADDIAHLLNQVVAYVKANPGSRSEHIVSGLGIDKKHLPRPIIEGLKSGALTKKGEKRATQYFLGEGGGGGIGHGKRGAKKKN